MRKLATIRRVHAVEEIPGADNIELIKIDGWQCVALKREFQVGDYGVYFEIDSFLPIQPRYEFLRKSCYHKMSDESEGFRLRTIRLRGALSQGLLLPLSILEPGEFSATPLSEGTDLTELLEIRLWEPPIPLNLRGVVKGTVPSVICKTDQERIQNLITYFTDYKDTPFEITEKMDGTSVTIYYNEGQFGCCGHNYEYTDTEGNTFWRVARKLKLDQILPQLGLNLALQGELVGEGIQKNLYKLKGQHFMLFDIWDIDRQCYYTPSQRREFHEKLVVQLSCPIKHVPILTSDPTPLSSFGSIEKILEFAAGQSLQRLDQMREGLVFKSQELIGGHIVHFKVLSNDYLLKHQEEGK